MSIKSRTINQIIFCFTIDTGGAFLLRNFGSCTSNCLFNVSYSIAYYFPKFTGKREMNYFMCIGSRVH